MKENKKITFVVYYTCDSTTMFTTSSGSGRECNELGHFAYNGNPLHYSSEARYLTKKLRKLGFKDKVARKLATKAMDSIKVREPQLIYDW